MRYNRIRIHPHTRILALDPHPRRFGYVVMETPNKLLDWGVRRSYRKTANHPKVVVARLRATLKIWMPDVVIVRVNEQRLKYMQALFKQIQKQVGERLFLPVGGHQVGVTKFMRALEIAARFPEIGWTLPSKRKPWESENYSTSIFEALETGCHADSVGRSPLSETCTRAWKQRPTEDL